MIYYSFIISGRFFQIIEIYRMMLFRSKNVIKLLHSNFYYAFKWNSETVSVKNVRLTLVNTPTQALAWRLYLNSSASFQWKIEAILTMINLEP